MNETKIHYLTLDRIKPSKTNPRKHFDETYITELSDSIRAKGILQPLLARPDWCIGKTDDEIANRVKEQGSHAANGNGAPAFYELVAGECRYRGAMKAKLDEAPAIIRLLSDTETLEIQLIENLQRSDLTPLEEAQAYRRLIDEMGYTVERIHDKTGKDRKTIYGKLTMLKAPKKLLDALAKEIVGERICELVGRIPMPEMREKAALEILQPLVDDFSPRRREDPMSYREAEEFVRGNFMRSLSGAEFDQKDATLVEVIIDKETGERVAGGACTDCPLRSGNMLAAFGGVEIKRPDVCLNPMCYGTKNARHFTRLHEAAIAEGKKVLTDEEAKGVFQSDGSIWFDSSYVKLSEQPDRMEVRQEVKKIPSWKKLLEDLTAKPQIVIARDPKGRTVELADRALAIDAVNLAAKEKGEQSIFDLRQARAAAGSRTAESADGEESEWKKQDRKNREIAKQHFKMTLAALGALTEAIDNKGPVKGFWDALIEASITHAGHDGAWLMCKRLELDPKQAKHKEGVAREGVESAVLEYGLSIPEEKWKLGFIVELLLSQRVRFSASLNGAGWNLKRTEVFKKFADLYGVDLEKIERDVRDETKSRKASPRDNGKTDLSGGVESRHAETCSESRQENRNGNLMPRAADKSGSSDALPACGGSAPPAQKIAKHKWEKITGNKYHCRNCGAAAVKSVKGEIVPANEFRGKPCIGESKNEEVRRKPRKASPRGRCSHCSSRAVPGKSMCRKCLAKNAARVKARRANRLNPAIAGHAAGKGGVKK